MLQLALLSKNYNFGNNQTLRAYIMLESNGIRLISKFNDILERRRLYIQMIATLLLAIGTFTAILTAAVGKSSIGYIYSWLVTSATLICCLGLALFAVTEIANLTLWRVSSSRLFRVIGFTIGRPANAHPSLIYAKGFYGALARRSMRSQGLEKQAQETFYAMIGEWEGSIVELCRFAQSLEQ